ncbi:MAG: branched-chain amino acid ABC transporter permease [Pseudomonadota bacterium]
MRKAYKRRLISFAPPVVIGLLLVLLPLFADMALVSLANKILIFGLLVMSLDFLVGYTGLWAFGHAAFFGLGAYTTAILTARFDVTSFWLTAPASVLMAALAACIFGLIALRVTQVYFLLITLAMGQLVFGIVNTSAGNLGALTGGSDGVGGILYPDLGFSFSTTTYFYFTLIIVALCSYLFHRIVNSPFGYSLQGMRASEIRLRALGYNTWLYKYIAFIIAGLFAGVAGVLYVYFNGYISPDSVGVDATGFLWLMIIVGGSGTLWGAFVGSAVVLSLQYFVSGITPERWPLILGACFVAAVIFFREGIFPKLNSLWKKLGDHGRIEG